MILGTASETDEPQHAAGGAHDNLTEADGEGEAERSVHATPA